MLLYGCESLCLAQKGMLIPLRNRQSKRIREICRVTMHQMELYSTTWCIITRHISRMRLLCQLRSGLSMPFCVRHHDSHP